MNDAGYTPSAEDLEWLRAERDRLAGEGADLLDQMHAFIGRFVAFPHPYYLDAVTLWAAHAHSIEHFHTTPRLAILSPEPESGKTRVLEILDLLTPAPMLTLTPSSATIFRKLAQQQVTLLIDECDTIFAKRGKDDQNEDLRALLNCGYRRGATIPRCVGPRHDVVDFGVFAAAALAGIGDLPDTIMTRSIVLKMRRRSADEQIEQYRIRLHEPLGHLLRDRLEVWACSARVALCSGYPELPECVVDRRAECWEPLISIADFAGGTWPKRARAAAVADVAQLREGGALSLGIKLLMDLRQIFGESDGMHTQKILEELNAMVESPWGDLYGKGLTDRGLAKRLVKYSVKPKDIRVNGDVRKGYSRADLWDVWERYAHLHPHPPGSATSATSAAYESAGGSANEGYTSATSATSSATCARCDGEGCGWCA